jgi:hypothetical protein
MRIPLREVGNRPCAPQSEGNDVDVLTSREAPDDGGRASDYDTRCDLSSACVPSQRKHPQINPASDGTHSPLLPIGQKRVQKEHVEAMLLRLSEELLADKGSKSRRHLEPP